MNTKKVVGFIPNEKDRDMSVSTSAPSTSTPPLVQKVSFANDSGIASANLEEINKLPDIKNDKGDKFTPSLTPALKSTALPVIDPQAAQFVLNESRQSLDALHQAFHLVNFLEQQLVATKRENEMLTEKLSTMNTTTMKNSGVRGILKQAPPHPSSNSVDEDDVHSDNELAFEEVDRENHTDEVLNLAYKVLQRGRGVLYGDTDPDDDADYSRGRTKNRKLVMNRSPTQSPIRNRIRGGYKSSPIRNRNRSRSTSSSRSPSRRRDEEYQMREAVEKDGVDKSRNHIPANPEYSPIKVKWVAVGNYDSFKAVQAAKRQRQRGNSNSKSSTSISSVGSHSNSYMPNTSSYRGGNASKNKTLVHPRRVVLPNAIRDWPTVLHYDSTSDRKCDFRRGRRYQVRFDRVRGQWVLETELVVHSTHASERSLQSPPRRSKSRTPTSNYRLRNDYAESCESDDEDDEVVYHVQARPMRHNNYIGSHAGEGSGRVAKLSPSSAVLSPQPLRPPTFINESSNDSANDADSQANEPRNPTFQELLNRLYSISTSSVVSNDSLRSANNPSKNSGRQGKNEKSDRKVGNARIKELRM